MSKDKERLDVLLVERGLAETRSRAQALILAGRVICDDHRRDKPGDRVSRASELRVKGGDDWASRGAHKLLGALEAFPMLEARIQGARCMDVGASTGGFTDYLLKAGTRSATCVDVGYGQLHYSLRQDERVTNLERMNARNLAPSDLPLPEYPLIVMDLSFISLRKVLPSIWKLLRDEGHLIALVKPQFEATKQEADRGKGIIRDDAVHTRILNEIKDFAKKKLPNSRLFAETTSTLKGTNGNTEYFLGWTKKTS